MHLFVLHYSFDCEDNKGVTAELVKNVCAATGGSSTCIIKSTDTNNLFYDKPVHFSSVGAARIYFKTLKYRNHHKFSGKETRTKQACCRRQRIHNVCLSFFCLITVYSYFSIQKAEARKKTLLQAQT